MNIHEAASSILKEMNRPMQAREIARIALERKMISSESKDPEYSLSQTIEKNIRDGRYNNPRLTFVTNGKKRFVALPTMKAEYIIEQPNKITHYQPVTLKLPIDLADKIHLATHARIASGFEETIIILIRKGLSFFANDIKSKLLNKIEEFTHDSDDIENFDTITKKEESMATNFTSQKSVRNYGENLTQLLLDKLTSAGVHLTLVNVRGQFTTSLRIGVTEFFVKYANFRHDRHFFEFSLQDMNHNGYLYAVLVIGDDTIEKVYCIPFATFSQFIRKGKPVYNQKANYEEYKASIFPDREYIMKVEGFSNEDFNIEKYLIHEPVKHLKSFEHSNN